MSDKKVSDATARMTITIGADVTFSLSESGTAEVTSVEADARLEDGAEFRFEPPIKMTSEHLDRLKHGILDAILHYIAKQQRNNLTKMGVAPIVEIIAVKMPQGQVH